MNPEKVNPHNFRQKKILFNDNEFSIAIGDWISENQTPQECLGMRWNGDLENSAGYPKTFGHPVWFIIPQNLTACFTKALAELEN
jgi:hypothetical protein